MECIYLDNAATSFPKAPGVSKAMARYTDCIGANVSRGGYAAAYEAERVLFEARQSLKTLFSFPYAESHVVWTSGATAALNAVLFGYLCPGDHVIVSALEHNAVMRPLTALSSSRGVTVSRIPASADGTTAPDAILPLFQKNTRLVLVSHVSNVCGAVLPVEAIAAACQAHGVPLVLDAAQSAGHIPIDYGTLGLSALCVPAHKGLMGPQGLGAMLLSPDFAKVLSPMIYGGTGSASDSEAQPEFMPDRFESGTLNLPAVYGLHAALQWLAQTGVERVAAQEDMLCARFIEGICDLPLRIVRPGSATAAGVVSLDFWALDNALCADRLAQEFHVLTRCGLHCAPAAHHALHTFPQGTVRFSFSVMNTLADAKNAAAAVRALYRR